MESRDSTACSRQSHPRAARKDARENERSPYENPVTKYGTNRPTKQRDLFQAIQKALNLELRFSGSFALHSQIRPTMLSSKRSATHTSRKGFD
jgi:hypothetical protein